MKSNKPWNKPVIYEKEKIKEKEEVVSKLPTSTSSSSSNKIYNINKTSSKSIKRGN